MFRTRGKTAAGQPYSIFAYDNPWHPTLVKVHFELPLPLSDTAARLAAINDIKAELEAQLPLGNDWVIRVVLYGKTENKCHIKGRGGTSFLVGGRFRGKI